MRTTVKVSPGLQPTFAAWERTLSPDPTIAAVMATALLDTLAQRLIDTEGTPADGFFDPTTSPPEYWYELTGGTWVVYTFTDGGLLFSRWRAVEVIGLAPRPSSRAVRTSPRT
jgi:hypothetical protein